LKEQTAIVQHIETETAIINDKINLAKQEIELLKEYGQALIFEAVTGKIKVYDT
jgi:type I restriction enzyme, S subunit